MKYKLINEVNKNYSIIEQILINRGIPFNIIQHYLHTNDNDINPPQALEENKLRNAVALLIQTIKTNSYALVIIDSDADGFTSAAILINYLHDLFPIWTENNLKYVLHQGKQHGLADHVDEIIKDNYKLIIVPDAGSNDIIECAKLRSYGKAIIVLDHHLCDEENPDAIVINNQLCEYSNKAFSGAGVVWQFCRYIDKLLKTSYAEDYLDLVALGNCADMMSMTSIETKHIVNKGFHNVKNPFFVFLSEKNNYSMKNKINHTSVAFYIAPYLNAICRSGTQEEKLITFKSMLKHEAFKTLPSTKRGHKLGETEKLVEQAMRIVTNVKSRQTKAQDAMLDTLEQMIIDKNLLEHKVLLFLMEPGQIEKNIAGLCANKMMAKYQRPTCILTKTIEEDGVNSFCSKTFDSFYQMPDAIKITYQGSARGCNTVGVKEFKSLCAETGLCEYCTGHEGAFGLGIDEDNIQAFIAATDAALVDMSDEPIYYVDCIYQGSDIDPFEVLTIADYEDLWGQDIPEPLLCISNLKVSADMVTVYQNKNNTLKISLPNGMSIIKFKATDEECEKLQSLPFGYYELDIIGKANKNEWNGNATAQIFVEDYDIVDSSKYIF